MKPILLSLNNRQIIVYQDQPIGREGGYGKVFKGAYTDNPLEQLAIKILKPELHKDLISVERFKREGSYFANIRHENLIETEGLVQQNNLICVVTRFIEGGTLQQVLDNPDENFDESAIIQKFLLPLLDVLEFLHETHQVIHRDVKAPNLIVEKSTGKLKLIDLGIAKINALPSLTLPGQKGPRTEQYAPPEMIRIGGTPTPATDLYSVGILLYLLLTKRLPFQHPNKEGLYSMILNKPLPYDRSISDSMWLILSKLTDKDQFKRHQNVAELRQDLFPPRNSPWKRFLNTIGFK